MRLPSEILGFALAAAAALISFGAVSRALRPVTWLRWRPARPEPRGWPRNTVLAVPGLERLPAEARRLLLALAEELRVPVDSLAVVIAHESGGKPYALNDLPAAGLIQITVKAGLPGLDTEEKIREVATWSAEEQILKVVAPFYRALLRQHPKLVGATPGDLLLANFLPADVGRPLDFRLGDSRSPEERRRKYYEQNKGLDRMGRGFFTVEDLHEIAKGLVRSSNGRRLEVG